MSLIVVLEDVISYFDNREPIVSLNISTECNMHKCRTVPILFDGEQLSIILDCVVNKTFDTNFIIYISNYTSKLLTIISKYISKTLPVIDRNFTIDECELITLNSTISLDSDEASTKFVSRISGDIVDLPSLSDTFTAKIMFQLKGIHYIAEEDIITSYYCCHTEEVLVEEEM